MPLVLADRVQETSTSSGTGTFTLAGAVTGFQSFAAIGNGNTTYYTITGGNEWEVGIGTYTSSGTTLSRDTVLSSSSGGAKVDFAAGTKYVFVTYPEERSVYTSGTSVVFSNSATVANNQLANSSVTLGSTSVSLGSTASALAGLSSVTVTQAPSSALQLATKQYVDDQVAAGITIHTPVRVETPTALNATYLAGGTAVTVTDITGNKTLTFSTSPSLSVNDQIVFSSTSNGITAGTAYYVYSAPAANQVTLSLSYNGPELTTLTNGTGLTIGGTVNAGVGATLTNAGTKAALQIDGVTLSTTNRVLVYNQANAAHNGIYTVTTVGTPDPGGTNWVLTRATTENTYKPDSTSGLGQGDYFFVQEGNTGAGESYVLTTTNPLIIGTTNLTFTQFAASQVYSAGTGLTLNGTQFSLTSPVVTTLGGTGLTSYTAGDLPYYATGTAFSKLGIGASSTILTSSGTAPQWSTASSVSVGTATNIAGGAQGSIPYQSGTGATVFLAKDTTATRYLANTGTSNNPAWSQIDLSNGVTGTLPIANGGTNATATPTNGGVSYGTGTAYAFTSAGTPGQVLTSAGAAQPTWTTATNANTASAIVQRDASGNFSAGTITAALTGNASTATTATNQSGGTVSATTGTFSGITQVTNTTASTLYTNGALVVSGGVGIAGRTTVNDILNRITGNGNSAWLQQDGTGRVHWYWNTYGGTSPTFTNSGEDASSISMSVTGSGAGGTFFHRSASGVGKIAGDAITWTTTVYADLNSFTYKGVSVALLGTAQTFTAAQTFRAANAIRSEAAATQDAVVLAGRAGGTASYAVTLTPTTLSANTTLTLPNVTDTVATIGAGQTFTGANTFRNASGTRFEEASTQDAVIIDGRAGGTSSYAVTIRPTTLSASRTVTLADGDVTMTAGTMAVLGTAQTFTAAQTFRAANAIRSEAASTQDAVVIAGRAGGTGSFAVTLTPTTLGANRTLTLPDASGTILQSGTAVTVPQGGTGVTTFTAYGLIAAGTTSTGNLQQVSGTGTSGQVLTSNGAGALPTWQASSSPAKASGAIIVNNTTISESYTIASGTNGFSVGPITVSSGFAVTVASGQKWVVI